jgi:hypothetical protein
MKAALKSAVFLAERYEVGFCYVAHLMHDRKMGDDQAKQHSPKN